MAPRGKGKQPQGEEDLLEQYSALLDSVTSRPFDRQLHLDHIDLTKKLGDEQGLESARHMMATYFPLPEAMWLEWISARKDKVAQAPKDDMTAHVELLELYKRANDDYLSIPLLVSYTQHVISNYYAAQGLSAPAVAVEDGDEDEVMEVERKVGEEDPILGAVFDIESVREVRKDVLAIGGGHLAESHLLWNLWRDFEMDLLKTNSTPEQLAIVDKLYLDRLAVPHTEMDAAFSAYSSFVTKYDNDNYGEKLPKANKAYSAARKTMNLREEEEAKLKKRSYADWAYIEYIAWEREVKRPDVPLVKNLCERAVKDFPENVELWDTYLEFAATLPKKSPLLLAVAEKAVKNVPGSGLLWAAYFRAAERTGPEVDVESLYARAIGTGLFDKEVDELVLLVEARAGYHRREVDSSLQPGEEADNADLIELVVHVLKEGIEKVRAGKKGGDPQMRLEKHLICVLERFSRLEEAAAVWEELTTLKPHSYAVWYGHADFETRMGNLLRAHEIYVKGCSAKGLDYPEYLLEAWATFEKQNGSLADLEFSMTKIKRQRKGLERKRYRDALNAAKNAPAVEPTASTSAATEAFIADAVQGSESAANDKKRERSPAPAAEAGEESASKKVRVEEAAPAPAPAASAPGAATEEVKRDRENSTVVVVSPAEAKVAEEDLKKLFRDCGEFRECKIKTIGEQTFAMIEFMERDNVLAAQTKDKKKINEHEIEVHVAWKSCLYVTNFPESYDKEAVEKLFSPHGTIFDTRWPSKRYKSTRRFCYIQFTTPTAAQSALALHGTELEGFKLQVFISDPGRKKGRTDAGANAKELYVAGLSKFVKELDLKRLFEPHGAIKGIRLGLDDKGECKGFAFVEFEGEASAQASLVLNNHELKKRHMSVTIAQPRAKGTHPSAHDGPKETKTAVLDRSIRVRGLPAGTEEAIVQQTFEKFGAVKVVVMEAGATDATVEMETAADAGSLLLSASSTPILVDGTPVEVFADGAQARTAHGRKPAATKAAGAGGDAPLLPRQASRGRGRVGLVGGRGGRGRPGIGSRGGGAVGGASSSGGQAAAAAPAAGKSQDDFRALFAKKE